MAGRGDDGRGNRRIPCAIGDTGVFNSLSFSSATATLTRVSLLLLVVSLCSDIGVSRRALEPDFLATTEALLPPSEVLLASARAELEGAVALALEGAFLTVALEETCPPSRDDIAVFTGPLLGGIILVADFIAAFRVAAIPVFFARFGDVSSSESLMTRSRLLSTR